MIQCQLKIRPTKAQQRTLNGWLWNLTGVWNWAVRKIEQDAKDGVRKDRNHKLSRRLVSENALICFSADNHRGISRKFGKSVTSSGHGQLRQMLAYKCRAGGRKYIEVPSKNSTRTCSACGCLSGPTGWTGLQVRTRMCGDCGTSHDRDINAAVNTLMAGVGLTHEGGIKPRQELYRAKDLRSCSTK